MFTLKQQSIWLILQDCIQQLISLAKKIVRYISKLFKMLLTIFQFSDLIKCEFQHKLPLKHNSSKLQVNLDNSYE